MADNETRSSPGASSATAPTTANLRIITLAHGSNREDDLFITVPLDYTIGELKERMKFIIAGTPPAEQQRLIYLGRPLLDNSAMLRSILRFQAVDQTTHVFHLVIRPNATSIPTATQSSANEAHSAPQQAQPQARQPHAIQPPQMPQIPNRFQDVLNPIQHAEQQANIFQQHMALHNQQVANFHHGLPQANTANIHQIHGPPPNLRAQVPNAVRSDQDGNSFPAHQPFGHEIPGTNLTMPGINPPQPPPQHGTTRRVQESVGPNGERIRVVTNSTGPLMHQELHNTLPTSPVERSASAPGTAERFATPGPTQMHRTYQHPLASANPVPLPHRQYHFSRSSPPNSIHAGTIASGGNPTVWLLNSPNGPQALLFAPGHGYFSTMPSSQNVPDASAASSTTDVNRNVQQPMSGLAERIRAAQNQRDQDQGQRNNRDEAQPRAELVLRPQGQIQPRPHPALNPFARVQNAEGGELVGFIIQRGWLFLRLYMFIFVLSEPGTWRRIILLGIATLVCFLPRQNPLVDAFNNARQHFDNLIGPPQPAQLLQPPADQAGRPRATEAVQDAGNNTANGAQNIAREGRQAMPTPEENARRLLREYQGRNHNFLRSLFHPVEQAVALFLASLIPGVGERHVRAREEARQLIAEEEQRRRTEAEQQQEQQRQTHEQGDSNAIALAEGTDNAGSGDESKREEPHNFVSSTALEEPTASSTAVDATQAESSSTASDGMRQRNNESNQIPSNLTADW